MPALALLLPLLGEPTVMLWDPGSGLRVGIGPAWVLVALAEWGAASLAGVRGCHRHMELLALGW